VFVDRAGRAVAAFIIMALTTRYLPVGLRRKRPAAVIALSGACILVAVRLRGSYSDALRRNLNRREVDLSEVSRLSSPRLGVFAAVDLGRSRAATSGRSYSTHLACCNPRRCGY